MCFYGSRIRSVVAAAGLVAFAVTASAGIPFDPQNGVSSGSLVFWLDANEASTIGTSGGFVDTWNDRSFSANHTDSINDERPEFIADAFGPGLNGVRFGSGNDGTPNNDNMLSFNTSPFSGSDFAITTIAVFQLAGTQGTFSSILGQSPGGGSMSFNVGNANSGGAFTDHWQPAGRAASLPIGVNEADPTHFQTRPTIVSWSTPLWEDHEANTNIYYDGTLVPGITYNTGASTLNPGEFIVGNWDITRSDMGLNGDLAELLVYQGELSETDRNNVNQYLGDKWGISLFPDLTPPPPAGLPITAIDVFDAVDQTIDRNRTGNLIPAFSIDNNPATFGSPTPSFTVDPVIIALGYENETAMPTNQLRVLSAAGATGLGGSDIDGAPDNDDYVNLEILWTADTGPLNMRTYQPVTGMMNGVNGMELLVAEQVNADGTIVRSNHAPETDGEFWSVTFDEVNATGLAVRVARDEDDDAAFVHYGVFEYESYLAVIDMTSLTGDYNGDGVVDAADYTVYRDNIGTDGSALANRDPANTGLVDMGDYDSWRGNFGATSGALISAPASVPEPTAGLLLLIGLAVAGRAATRRC